MCNKHSRRSAIFNNALYAVKQEAISCVPFVKILDVSTKGNLSNRYRSLSTIRQRALPDSKTQATNPICVVRRCYRYKEQRTSTKSVSHHQETRKFQPCQLSKVKTSTPVRKLVDTGDAQRYFYVRTLTCSSHLDEMNRQGHETRSRTCRRNSLDGVNRSRNNFYRSHHCCSCRLLIGPP